MPKLVDLEKVDVFGKGVKSFRIVSTERVAEPRRSADDLIENDSVSRIGQALREQQERARNNRKR